jgi:uncharacterized 2Fe-2S/4Fe-4S cluster protein (DUF4445 family)
MSLKVKAMEKPYIARSSILEDVQQVCFTPSGRQFKGEAGDTLLQVAQDAGVAIRSLCGGYGQCHQCWIEVSEGAHPKFGVDCKP